MVRATGLRYASNGKDVTYRQLENKSVVDMRAGSLKKGGNNGDDKMLANFKFQASMRKLLAMNNLWQIPYFSMLPEVR